MSTTVYQSHRIDRFNSVLDSLAEQPDPTLSCQRRDAQIVHTYHSVRRMLRSHFRFSADTYVGDDEYGSMWVVRCWHAYKFSLY
jgi:hypothetical protein